MSAFTRAVDALCTPEAKMPGWLDPSATRVRLKEAINGEEPAGTASNRGLQTRGGH